MKRSRLLSATVLLTAGALLAGCAAGASGAGSETEPTNSYEPHKPQMLIPFAAGGGLDLAGRNIATVLNEEGLVEKPFETTNMPGGGAGVGMQHLVSNSAGDGDQLMVIAAHVVLTPMVQGGGVTYKDMTPIADIYSETPVMAVAADSPLQDLGDLVDALKADPGSVTIGGASAAGLDSVVTGQLALDIGIDPTKVKFVSYDGSTPIAALLGDHIDVALGGPDFIDLIKSGDMRALGVTSDDRLPGDFADIPTFKEQGVDLVIGNWRMIFGPPEMPEDAIAYWKAALKKMTETDAWKSTLDRYAFTPEFQDTDLDKFLDSETDRYRKALEGLGLI
jgi:putative tricarboxylic transport membrane protein